MKFYSAIKGQIILIKPLKPKPQPPTCAIVAKSIIKRPSLFRVIADEIGRKLLPAKPFFFAVMFLGAVVGNVIIEGVASGYLNKMVG